MHPGVGESGGINISVARFYISMEWGLLLE